MAEWIYLIHPPRDDFAATMTAQEKAVWAEHFARLQRLVADGRQPLRDGADICFDGRKVGILTSGNFSPMRERGIGMSKQPQSRRPPR